jgi:hypothetical protein
MKKKEPKKEHKINNCLDIVDMWLDDNVLTTGGGYYFYSIHEQSLKAFRELLKREYEEKSR